MSAVYSQESSVSIQISVFVRSIKDLNLNVIKIKACEAGSPTQLSFLLLGASQQRSNYFFCRKKCFVSIETIEWQISN